MRAAGMLMIIAGALGIIYTVRKPPGTPANISNAASAAGGIAQGVS